MEKNIQNILQQLSNNFTDRADNLYHNAGYDGNGVLETQISYAKQEIYRQIADVLDETIYIINKEKKG
jgi:hypothetical protein|tara:strand:+ start:501 stop:704 length:204 start_codon:yes stop_codon:yes gene_type:complete